MRVREKLFIAEESQLVNGGGGMMELEMHDFSTIIH